MNTARLSADVELFNEDYTVDAGLDVPSSGDYTPVTLKDSGETIKIVNRSVDLTADIDTMVIVMWSGIEWVPVWVDCG